MVVIFWRLAPQHESRWWRIQGSGHAAQAGGAAGRSWRRWLVADAFARGRSPGGSRQTVSSRAEGPVPARRRDPSALWWSGFEGGSGSRCWDDRQQQVAGGVWAGVNDGRAVEHADWPVPGIDVQEQAGSEKDRRPVCRFFGRAGEVASADCQREAKPGGQDDTGGPDLDLEGVGLAGLQRLYLVVGVVRPVRGGRTFPGRACGGLPAAIPAP